MSSDYRVHQLYLAASHPAQAILVEKTGRAACFLLLMKEVENGQLKWAMA